MTQGRQPHQASSLTPLHSAIEQRLRQAVVAAMGPDLADIDPLLRPAAQPQFGDFQANLAMGLAKRVGTNPRALAQSIASKLDPADLFEKVEIAGPGFINLTLAANALTQATSSMLADERLGVPAAVVPQRIVVDYSAPNVAKEMHIGHLRSTIIGDALVRVLEFLGHTVIRQNHLGDWGTQFGMLLEYLEEHPDLVRDDRVAISDLSDFYRAAKRRFDEDADFVARARERVVRLQAGDAYTVSRWEQLVAASLVHFEAIYERLDVLLEPSDIRGESAYNDALPRVIEDLSTLGLLRESDGARVVHPDGFFGKEGEPYVEIVQKSDGGYLYATTDLAAARYRVDVLRADRVIYLSDARQSDHFARVFQILRQAGWTTEKVRWDHVPFGSILGPDRKPFKTREGGTVRLVDVLDEAESRARAVIAEKRNPDLDEQQAKEVARVLGLGALKYFDLSSDRIKDYVFDWDRMLALDGNTAPYAINAYVRIRAIFRKADRELASAMAAEIQLTEPEERALMLQLIELPRVIEAVAESLEPHRLCTYLYELASRFHRFYERCPVAIVADPSVRESRLALSAAVARTLELGLGLLGIGTVSRM